MARFLNYALASALFAVLLLHSGESVKFAISHWNDVSAQFEEYEPGTYDSSAAPKPCHPLAERCLGGLVPLTHWINDNSTFSGIEARNQIRLSSGNLIGGESGWIPSSITSWKDYGRLVQKHWKPNVIALGMKEFGAGVNRTLDYLNGTLTESNTRVLYPVNTCLGDISKYPYEEKKFCTLIQPVETIEVVDGSAIPHKIGVVGFLTPNVEQLALPGKLEFHDVVEYIKREVTQSDNAEIKTFIAIGDGNLEMARKIIEEVPKVKLVIYGAGLANTKNMTGDYPMKYKKGYIATAGRYGSSVGKLVLEVNTDTGDITSVTGSVLKVTKHVPETSYTDEDKEANSALAAWQVKVDKEKENILGVTRVTLAGGKICWRGECNLGNLVADAMVHCVLSQTTEIYPAQIHSIWHGGAFFEDEVKANSKISKFDVHKWLPYHNRAHLVTVSGYNLKKIFELSAGGIDPVAAGVKDWRQFLQVSNGLEVYYTTESGKPVLKKVRIAQDELGVPKLQDMIDGERYYLVIPTYLYEGRGVYGIARNDSFWGPVAHEGLGNPNFEFDDNCVENYIVAMNHVTTGIEERIFIDADGDGDGGKGDLCNCPKHKTAVTVTLTIVFFSLILAIIYVGYFYVLPRLQRPHVEYPPNQL